MQKALQLFLQIAGYLTTAAGVVKLVPDILTALSGAFTAAATFDYGALVASVTVVAAGLGLILTAILGKNAETARAMAVIERAKLLVDVAPGVGEKGLVGHRDAIADVRRLAL